MPIRLWVCTTAVCTVLLFKNTNGCCNRCGQPGLLIVWTLKEEP